MPIENVHYLRQYINKYVIYSLYTDKDGVKYVGYSRDVYSRFLSHLRYYDYELDYQPINWIKNNKERIKINILSVDPEDWESEWMTYINMYRSNNLLNITPNGQIRLIEQKKNN